MLQELLKWVPNLQQLVRWVGNNRLHRALILGGFTADDFKKRWQTTPAANPHFPNAMYEITGMRESDSRPKRMEYHYNYASEESDGYPRLLLALIRVKFPSLRDESFKAYKDCLFLDTPVGTFYLDYDYLFKRDARRLSICIQRGIDNQVSYQAKGQPHLTKEKLTDNLLATESYRNLCIAMKVDDL